MRCLDLRTMFHFSSHFKHVCIGVAAATRVSEAQGCGLLAWLRLRFKVSCGWHGVWEYGVTFWSGTKGAGYAVRSWVVIKM